MAAPAPILEPIGPYRVLRPIARGGMAEVYEVEDPVSGERFALKLLMHGESALPRFNREYEAMARLNHPNIVRVYHYGFHRQKPWITMELVQGTTLQTRVKQVGRAGDPARTTEVLRVMWYVADALQYIHDRGLVHRDLKSDNVLVLPDGRVKLLDFGTAHLVDAIDKITREGEFVGTFAYAAPEQIGGGAVDPRSDLYSLGVLLYRLCTGKRLFATNDPLELARLHAKAPPRPPRELVPDLSPQLETLILWMLEKQPERRPQRADQISRALGELLGPLPSQKLVLSVDRDRAIGRESEVLEVLQHLNEGEVAEMALIEGVEGSGRERFCRAVAAQAMQDGWAVLQGSVPKRKELVALASLVEGAATGVDSDDVDAALQAFRGRLEGAVDVGDREVLARAGALVLAERARAEGRPMLLVLQHLHRASPRLLDLLSALREALAREEVTVRWLASVRDQGEASARQVLQRFPDARLLELHPLSVQGVALTVGALLHQRPPDTALARRIHVASAGHPAYVEEIVRRLLDAGALYSRGRDGNRLACDAVTGDLPVARTARETMEAALLRLPRAWRRVLEALSVAGEATVGLEGLAGMLELSASEVEPSVQGLAKAGWLALEGDQEAPRVRWARVLARQVVEGMLDPARRGVLQRGVARGLQSEGPTQAMARALLAAGQPLQAAQAALSCAERLLELRRPLDAEPLLAEVTRALKNLEDPGPDHVRVQLLHLQALLELRPTDPIVPRTMVRLQAQVQGDEAAAGRLALLRARLQSVIGHYPNHRKHLEQAWTHAQAARDARLCAEVASHLGQASQWAGQPRTATEWFERARLMAQASGRPLSLSAAEVAHAEFLCVRGEFAEARRLALAALDRYEALSDAEGAGEAVAVLGHALREEGRYTEALAAIYERLPAARQGQTPIVSIRLLLVAARCEVDLYRLGRAQEWLDELESVVRSGEYLHLRLEARLLGGRIQYASGQYRDALEILHDVLQRARNAELVGLAEHARALYAECLWALGDAEPAREAFRAACIGLMGTGEVATLAEACASKARALAEEEDPEETFRSVQSLLQAHPTSPFLVEKALAVARRRVAQGDPQAARRAWREAAGLLNRFAAALGDTERSALRVHPWSRRIRRGLG